MYKVTWVEAQRHCMYDKSNLLTITERNEYDVVNGKNNIQLRSLIISFTSFLDLYGKNGEQPWVGVFDATEGKFESLNPTDTLDSSM